MILWRCSGTSRGSESSADLIVSVTCKKINPPNGPAEVLSYTTPASSSCGQIKHERYKLGRGPMACGQCCVQVQLALEWDRAELMFPAQECENRIHIGLSNMLQPS